MRKAPAAPSRHRAASAVIGERHARRQAAFIGVS
jgi:hypothetical protein